MNQTNEEGGKTNPRLHETVSETPGSRVLMPPPAELAQIAAALLVPHPGYHHESAQLDAAIKEAIRLYSRAVSFCHEHQGDTPERLALVVGDIDAVEQDLAALCHENSGGWPDDIPKPKAFPASLNEFLKLVVTAKTRADATARLRAFLGYFHQHFIPNRTAPQILEYHRETLCTQERAETWAAETIGTLKKQGLSENTWVLFTRRYEEWWQAQRSIKARESAQKRKHTP